MSRSTSVLLRAMREEKFFFWVKEIFDDDVLCNTIAQHAGYLERYSLVQLKLVSLNTKEQSQWAASILG